MPVTETVCYKIRDSETGLWSSGGTEPRFNKVGKSWSSSGHLINHLAQFRPTWVKTKYNIPCGIPDMWEVVTFRMVVDTTESATVSARELFEKHEASK